MAKQSGLGDQLYVGGYDVSGDIGSMDKISGGPAALDRTGINKSAFERVGGIRDGGIDFTAWFNPGPEANAAHLRLALLPYVDVGVLYSRGSVAGVPGAGCVAKQVDYAAKRGQSDGLSFAVSAVANGSGVEWGVMATAGVRADTTATNGAALDYGSTIGTTAFGLQGHAQLTAFTGTSVTIKIQHSDDNGVGDAWADLAGGSFGALSAIGASRIETARTQSVKRWLRVVTTGTFTVASFAVMLAKNELSVTF